MLLAGGVLNAILVPQLIRAMRKDKDGGQAFSDRIVTLFLLLLLGLTVLLVLGTQWVTQLVTHPVWRTPELASQYQSLLTLAALCMPQVFFFGAFFLGGQLLNARDSFGPLMWAPTLNNIIQILMLGTYAVVWGFHTDTAQPFSHDQILLLGIGSVLGVFCQAIVLLPFLKKVGFRYRPRFDFLHTGLGSTAHMAKWALALVAIDQANFLIITKVASVATAEGHGAGLTVFNSAMLVSLVPHALLTVSLATALMPSLARLSDARLWLKFTEQLTISLKVVFSAIIPVALLFAAMGISVATLVWSTAKGGEYIGWTLVILGLGLIPFSLRFLVNKAFNSMGNTRTPFFTEIIFVGVTCIVSVVLVFLVKVPTVWVAPSIAAGYTLGYLASNWLSWRMLRMGVPGMATTRIFGYTAGIIALALPGSLVAAAICWLQARYLPYFPVHLLSVIIAAVLAVVIYWGLARLARVPEILHLETMIRARLGRTADAPRRAL
jgi:putative peptidoglycan lipid II flippase